MWRRMQISVLLAASVIASYSSAPVSAGEFANEFEEYEHYAGSVRNKARRSPAVTYRVKKGDTLYSIARAYRVSPAAIMDENKLGGKSLTAGSRIRIPSGENKSAVKTRPCSGTQDRSAKNDGFIWPVQVVRGVRRDGENGVRPIGILISSRSGAAVVSSAPGVVEKVGTMRGFGAFVVVRHYDSIITVYTQLGAITVREGDSVERGGQIGHLSREATALHFMVHRGGKPADPLKYLPER